MTGRKNRAHRAHRRFDNLDASENGFFEEQLWQIKSRTYDRKYPNLKARQFIPLDTEIDPTTDTLKIRSYSQVGAAQLLKTYADDLPRSDIKADEMTVTFKGLGASYGYGLDEVRKASRARLNLDAAKGAAARRAIEVQIDRILALGDTATGLVGLLTQPNALTFTVPAGAALGTEWTTKTPNEITDDLIGICEYIYDTTNEVESPNMVIVPRAQFVKIRTTKHDPTQPTTILQWFQAVYPGVGIDTWYRLRGAGAGGTDRMVAYSMTPDHLQGAVPQEFEQLPPQERNLEFVIPCHARIGGVAVYYPYSMAYGDGI